MTIKNSLLFITSLIFSQLSYASESSPIKKHSMRLRHQLPEEVVKSIAKQLDKKNSSEQTPSLSPKPQQQYACTPCDYTTKSRYHFREHKKTINHKKIFGIDEYKDEIQKEHTQVDHMPLNAAYNSAISANNAQSVIHKTNGAPLSVPSYSAGKFDYQCKSCLASFHYFYQLAEHQVPGHEKSCPEKNL